MALLSLSLSFGCYYLLWTFCMRDAALQKAVSEMPQYTKRLLVQHAGSLLYLVLLIILQTKGEAAGGAALVQHGLLFSSLLAAAWIDHYTKEIPDVVYLPGAIAGVSLLIGLHPGKDVWSSLCWFFAIQWLLFRHLYGGSDCLAYSLCAVHLASAGGELLDYLLFMLLATGLEAAVQIKQKNVGKKGHLKEPVALIPYIAAAMPVWKGTKWFITFAAANISP